MRKILNTSHLMGIYYALFWSIASYGVIVWGGAYASNIKILEDIHKRILKIIFRKNITYPSELIFSENNILTLRKAFLIKSLLHNYLQLKNIYINKITANKRVLYLQPPITNNNNGFARQNHYYLSFKIFNLLPDQLKLKPMKIIQTSKILINWIMSIPNHAITNLLSTAY